MKILRECPELIWMAEYNDSCIRSLGNYIGKEDQKTGALTDISISHRLNNGNFGNVFMGKWASTSVALKRANKLEDESMLRKEVAILQYVSVRKI